MQQDLARPCFPSEKQGGIVIQVGVLIQSGALNQGEALIQDSFCVVT